MTQGRFIAAAAIGLLLAACTIILGFVLIGMGHGPDAPIKLSWLTAALYPLALTRVFATSQGYGWLRDIVTILAAIALLFLVVDFLPQGIAPEVWVVMMFGLSALIAAIAGFAAVSYLASRFGRHLLVGDILLLSAAIPLNVELYSELSAHSFEASGGSLLLLWLVFWVGWQAASLLAFIKHLRILRS